MQNFILHAAGWLEGGLVTSYEKLIIDADRLGAMQRMLQGMEVDDNALAKDAYLEVNPGEHFLGCAHTMKNYETAFYESKISDSESYEQWCSNGEKTADQRANERWKKLLNDYAPPPIDEAVDEQLQAFMTMKKEQSPDKWY